MVARIGIGLVVYGLKKKFEKHLNTGADEPEGAHDRRAGSAWPVTPPRASRTAIAGVLRHGRRRERTTRRRPAVWTPRCKTLREQRYGPGCWRLVALGIAAFGVYCFFQARYRKV